MTLKELLKWKDKREKYRSIRLPANSKHHVCYYCRRAIYRRYVIVIGPRRSLLYCEECVERHKLLSSQRKTPVLVGE